MEKILFYTDFVEFRARLHFSEGQGAPLTILIKTTGFLDFKRKSYLH